MFKLDKETSKLMQAFKTVTDKQALSDILAEEAVTTGIRCKSKILEEFYGDIDVEFVKKSCISFGLMNFTAEDFFVVKEILSYDYIIKLINSQNKYLRIVH